MRLAPALGYCPSTSPTTDVLLLVLMALTPRLPQTLTRRPGQRSPSPADLTKGSGRVASPSPSTLHSAQRVAMEGRLNAAVILVAALHAPRMTTESRTPRAERTPTSQIKAERVTSPNIQRPLAMQCDPGPDPLCVVQEGALYGCLARAL